LSSGDEGNFLVAGCLLLYLVRDVEYQSGDPNTATAANSRAVIVIDEKSASSGIEHVELANRTFSRAQVDNLLPQTENSLGNISSSSINIPNFSGSLNAAITAVI
jgi:hypothetical protein